MTPPLEERIDQFEERFLAPYAMKTAASRGRKHPEPAHPFRSAFMRDRDRIIHSRAFRRLMYKTQVFVGPPNDHQRTRLTHTLEVVQIARTIARNLRLNEDLVEAMALVHDVGHPPFGHAGERALQRQMAEHGGFEHNRHGLRLVDRLEQRYPHFAGLNLSFEILETLALRADDAEHPDIKPLRCFPMMLLEGQVVDAADSIAYDAHDIDDALRGGLLEFPALCTLELWRDAEAEATATAGRALLGKDRARGAIRAFIDRQVRSVIETSARRLIGVTDRAVARLNPEPLIGPELALGAKRRVLEQFLMEQVYRHERVLRTTERAEVMIERMFEALVRQPHKLPAKDQHRLAHESIEQVVCDYLAGMTDRYAHHFYRTLFEP